jgi:5'-AMP-activated protein kinase catalytic alpha subunit
LKILDFKLHHIEINQTLNQTLTIKTIPMIITEFCEGGNLLTYLQSNHSLSEKESNYLFKQLISGLEFAHSLKIIHHDIKLENLLLKKKPQPQSSYFLSRVASQMISYFVPKTMTTIEDVDIFSYELKICDWGFARVGNENLNQYSGSPHYSAPEVYTKDKMTEMIDIWSAGVCLYAMSTGKLPFFSSDPVTLKNMIIGGKYNADFLESTASLSLKNLLENILVVDPDKRFTISHIKNHPWFNSFSFADEFN